MCVGVTVISAVRSALETRLLQVTLYLVAIVGKTATGVLQFKGINVALVPAPLHDHAIELRFEL